MTKKLGREVAIKVLPDSLARDPERVARFRREAKLLASLIHPNIASIYGFEETDSVRFIVLELLEGETLADRLGRGALPVEEESRVITLVVTLSLLGAEPPTAREHQRHISNSESVA